MWAAGRVCKVIFRRRGANGDAGAEVARQDASKARSLGLLVYFTDYVLGLNDDSVIATSRKITIWHFQGQDRDASSSSAIMAFGMWNAIQTNNYS